MPAQAFAPYTNAHKRVSDNRDDYFAQSRMTTNGYRPTIAEARAMRAAEYAATAAPDQFYEADISDGFTLKYL